MKKISQLLASLLLLVFCSPIFSQEYPNRPIRFVIGYAPGGVADITARAVAKKLGEGLGQQVVVENFPGAGGIVAAETVAKSKPDGYTILLLNYGDAGSAAYFKNLSYDIRKTFTPVSTLANFDLAILVRNDSKIKSISNLQQLANANPNKLNIGTTSIGSGLHLASLLFLKTQNLPITIVPYKSTPAITTALKAGDIDLAFDIIYPALPHIQAQEFIPIAVTSKNRSYKLPNTPTLEEQGVTNYREFLWNGIAVPADTPQVIVNKLNREIQVALASSEIQAKFLEVGITPKGSTPDEFKKLISSEVDKWIALISQMKIERQ
jgi:tripartite-type tricarboxylate transporter receptor subunit TctC